MSHVSCISQCCSNVTGYSDESWMSYVLGMSQCCSNVTEYIDESWITHGHLTWQYSHVTQSLMTSHVS